MLRMSRPGETITRKSIKMNKKMRELDENVGVGVESSKSSLPNLPEAKVNEMQASTLTRVLLQTSNSCNTATAHR